MLTTGPAPTSTCTRCKAEKPATEFSRSAASPNGLRIWCKPCVSVKNREYRAQGRGKARVCTRCGADFIQASSPSYCRPCQVAKSAESEQRRKQWRAANPEAAHLRKKAGHLKKYGITLAEYDALLERQDGGCAICGVAKSGHRKLCVDHCHTTGRVRGLLCNRCNYALGQVDDRPELLRKAADYLERR